jgi:hypothetical protein
MVDDMAERRLAYQIWDDETGNIIAKYGTQDGAVAFFQAMLDANGPDGVRDLVIVEYPVDGSAPRSILDGVAFLAQRKVVA